MYTLDTHLQLSASAQASRWSPVGRLDRMHTRPIHMVIQSLYYRRPYTGPVGSLRFRGYRVRMWKINCIRGAYWGILKDVCIPARMLVRTFSSLSIDFFRHSLYESLYWSNRKSISLYEKISIRLYESLYESHFQSSWESPYRSPSADQLMILGSLL